MMMKTYTNVSYDPRATGLHVADQEEFPTNVCKSIRCDLQVNEICQSKDEVRQCYAFRSHVNKEHLAVENVAANIHTKLIHCVEAEKSRHTKRAEILSSTFLASS